MNEQASSSGFLLKVLAFGVLLLCAWLLLKVVIGVVTTIAWIAVIVAALFGVLWAMSVLRR